MAIRRDGGNGEKVSAKIPESEGRDGSMGRFPISVAFPIHPCFCYHSEVIQDSKNYSTLECVQGIKDAVLTKQMESLQTVLLSMNKTLDGFHSIVLSLEKIFRDGRQLVKGGSAAPTATQLKQRVGVKPSLSDCLEGLKILYEMHHSEYLLKVSVVSALAAVALKKSASDHLGAFQQLLVDQPNITQEDVTIVAHYGSSPPSCS